MKCCFDYQIFFRFFTSLRSVQNDRCNVILSEAKDLLPNSTFTFPGGRPCGGPQWVPAGKARQNQRAFTQRICFRGLGQGAGGKVIFKLNLNNILDLPVNQSSHPCYLFEGTIETGAERPGQHQALAHVESPDRLDTKHLLA